LSRAKEKREVKELLQVCKTDGNGGLNIHSDSWRKNGPIRKRLELTKERQERKKTELRKLA